MTGNLHSGDLHGPQRFDAEKIIQAALTMSTREAQRLSDLYETYDDPDYIAHCTVVWDALETTGRHLPLGWFEAIFANCAWSDTTKALHAVADAVVATLVADVVPPDVVKALTSPWVFSGRKTVLRLTDKHLIMA